MDDSGYRLLERHELIGIGDELTWSHLTIKDWVTINPKSFAIGYATGNYLGSMFRRKESMKSKIMKAF